MPHNKKPHLVWIDIPADDVNRSKKFYSELFGWNIEKDTNTKPPTDYFMLSNPGELTPAGHPHYFGGILKRQHPKHNITIYIDVPSVDAYSEKIVKLGGKLIAPKKAIPGWGYFAIFSDTENNPFAIWEQNKDAK